MGPQFDGRRLFTAFLITVGASILIGQFFSSSGTSLPEPVSYSAFIAAVERAKCARRDFRARRSRPPNRRAGAGDLCPCRRGPRLRPPAAQCRGGSYAAGTAQPTRDHVLVVAAVPSYDRTLDVDVAQCDAGRTQRFDRAHWALQAAPDCAGDRDHHLRRCGRHRRGQGRPAGVVEFLRDPQKFQRLGGPHPRGCCSSARPGQARR